MDKNELIRSKKLFLFDMDGTLTDTMLFWKGIPARLLAEDGIVLAPEQAATLDTMGLVKGLEYIRSLHLSSKADRYGYEDVVRVLSALYDEGATAKPCVHELLSELKKKGVRMGVATLTPSGVARGCLTRTGLIHYFDFLLGGEDYPEGKSEPRIFLDAAQRITKSVISEHVP